jgi:hypothetical protein
VEPIETNPGSSFLSQGKDSVGNSPSSDASQTSDKIIIPPKGNDKLK